MRRTFYLVLELEGEQGDLPTEAELASILANSTAAEALAEATGCEVTLSFAEDH